MYHLTFFDIQVVVNFKRDQMISLVISLFVIVVVEKQKQRENFFIFCFEKKGGNIVRCKKDVLYERELS